MFDDDWTPEDDPVAQPPDLVVDWAPPNTIGVLIGVDGTLLIEVTDRDPAGYR